MQEAEVLIVGGGLNGLLAGCLLARQGIKPLLVDRSPCTAGGDGRASALSYGSAEVLKELGLWPVLQEDASPIHHVRVTEDHPLKGPSSCFVHYDHEELGGSPLGYVVENTKLLQALRAEAVRLGFQMWTSTEVTDVMFEPSAAVVSMGPTRVRTPLLVAADGRHSPLRKRAGIDTVSYPYNQTALVCTVAHEHPHGGVAVELFSPMGPFAMLPMTGQRTHVIWAESPKGAQALLDLDEEGFLEALRGRFGSWLGEISLAGPLFSYPLSFVLARKMRGERLVLLGDSAHGIHPVAGQGFNLGVRDSHALAMVVEEAWSLGLDHGTDTVLEMYEARRALDTWTMSWTCDGLVRLFSHTHPLIRSGRRLGLSLVQRTPPLKRLLMRHAMGLNPLSL